MLKLTTRDQSLDMLDDVKTGSQTQKPPSLVTSPIRSPIATATDGTRSVSNANQSEFNKKAFFQEYTSHLRVNSQVNGLF